MSTVTEFEAGCSANKGEKSSLRGIPSSALFLFFCLVLTKESQAELAFPFCSLLSQSEIGNELSVLIDIPLADVLKETAALSDKLEKPTP